MDDIREYLSMLRRRWEIPFWCITFCLGSAVFIAYTTPPIYRSTGTIIIDSADFSLNPTTRPVAAVGGIDQHLDMVRRRVLSDENAQTLIEKYNLFPDVKPSRRRAALIDNVKLEQIDPITMEPLIGGSAFHVHFNYPVADTAQEVGADLLGMFLADNRKARMQSAAEEQDFFAAQSKRLAKEVAEVESRLAAFKRENSGLLPDDIRLNQEALERAQQALTAIQSEIRFATERRNLLTVQLDAVSRDTELATLKAELAVARQRYTEEHPDVIRLERTIAALEESGSDISQEDPAYRQVMAQLRAAENQLSAFRERADQLRAEIAKLSERLVLAPEVEKELQELNREYDLVTAQYREMRQRRGAAEVATNLEEVDKGERYTIMRAASFPSTPFSPNRLGIILIGTMLALAGSAILVALREGADETVRSSRDIVQSLNGPPIATIPVIRNDVDKLRLYRRLGTHAVVWVLFVGFTFGAVLYG